MRRNKICVSSESRKTRSERDKNRRKKFGKRLIDRERDPERKASMDTEQRERRYSKMETQDVKILRQRKQLEFELSVLEKQRRRKKMLRKKLDKEQREGIEAF